MKFKFSKNPHQTLKNHSFLIGENHLLIKCAEILIKNHHEIIGIVSCYPAIKNWASSYKIPVFKSLDDAQQILDTEPMDYLFSIVNSNIIPTSLLNKANKLAINYHYSPLPKYAGMNAPSWAILNDESQHGITWHELSDTIDGGKILKQSFFEISKDETALTLNHKCYQEGVLLFEQLLEDLANDTLKPITQDMSKRTYFSLGHKPLHNGILDWELSAEEIGRLFRACNLGIFDNAFSVLKIKLKETCYIVSELELCTHSSDCLPGTLVETNPAFWRIATTTKDINISKIHTLYGKECSLPDLLHFHKINAGISLKLDPSNDLLQFQTSSMESSKQEAFWVKQFLRFEAAEFPFTNQFVADEYTSYELMHTFKCSEELISKINSSGYKMEDLLLSTWLIYLHRIGNKKNLGIALNYSELTQFIQSNPLNQFFNSSVPFKVQLQENATVDEALTFITQELERIKSKKTFLKDMFYRYPALTESTPFIPLCAIIEEASSQTPQRDINSLIILKISLKDNKLALFIRKNELEGNDCLSYILSNTLKHYELLLNSLLNDKNQFINELEYISQEEKAQLSSWNNTYIDFHCEDNIGLLVDKAFEKYPDNIALHLEETFLTFRELQGRVDLLIDYFIKNQIKQQEALVVYMPSSLEWVICVLAIIKYGAIYVPVVHTIPHNRLKLIAADSKAKVLITNTDLKEELAYLPFENIIDAEEVLENHVTTDSPNIPHFTDQAIAYLLYTSGTTGVPKGVVIKHKGVLNLVNEQSRSLPLDEDTKVLQFAPIGFDPSIWEIFATLNTGGTLCIPQNKTLLLGENLSKTINFFKITLITLPPSILKIIRPEEVPTLKAVVTAGESCSRELADEWINHLTLINAYGPTETTVCATMGVINKTGEINIGKPIANTQMYVLDENRNPVPPGVNGELYIGGVSLALGYLNQLELTQQYFIPNPFSTSDSERIYRTRDVGRWLPNGTIEYRGRIDHQFKFRGQRIEPEAIEAQILHHPHITDCVVSLQKLDQSKEGIVAYYISKKTIDLEDLRKTLREHLPHYMIPVFFVTIDSLPLTDNGKIDRKALPVPYLKSNLDISNYVPPSTEIERKLCKIWVDLLGMEPIGINHDFFSLGGNSLSLSQLIITIKNVFNFEMHFSTILNNFTISYIHSLISKKFEQVSDENYKKRLLNDTILVKNYQPLANTSLQEPTYQVLLTGVTGFLGIHLLKELYTSNKNLQIYCVVRASCDEEARISIANTIRKYGFDFPIDERIIPLAGDISSPHLGLQINVFNYLAKKLDEIYHSAAFVHHLYNYDMLKSTNVSVTIELIKLASLYKNKRIHYVSTLSALTGYKDKNGYIIEDFITPDTMNPPENGYNQTKWVSEKLLAEASNRGYSINIYRPGWILGKNLGLSSSKNHFLSLAEGCLQMNCAPNWDVEFNILPVEFMSRMIVKISSLNHFNNKVFNFSNSNTVSWTDIIEFLNKQGNQIKIIDKIDWSHALSSIGKGNSLFSLLSLYGDSGNKMDDSLNEGRYSDDKNVQMAMHTFNENYPVVNQELLSNFLLPYKNNL